MSASAYWAQWSPSEIMSMYGVEEYSHDDAETEQDYVDVEMRQPCECLNCMKCLGVSWNDFM